MQQLPPIRPDLHYWRPESLAGTLKAWTLTTSPDEMADISWLSISKKYSITFGKLTGKGHYQDDYWLRAVTTWNFLHWYLCWYFIFLASAEYINLEMNLKVTEVTSSQFGDTLLYAGPGFPLFWKNHIIMEAILNQREYFETILQ